VTAPGAGYFHDVLDASGELVGWWPAAYPSDAAARAGLASVRLTDGQQARVLHADTATPFAAIRAGVVEVVS
jgi:hypothetical protein